VDDKEKRFVDELLGASFRRYASAEARPGLEGRVLAGGRARQQAERRRAAWTWALGTAAMAALVALLVFHLSRRQRAQLPETTQARATVAYGQKGTDRGYQLAAPTAAEIAPPVQPHMPRRPPRSATQRWVETRPQQFPTPRPLSEQEKLLLAYVQLLKSSSAALAPEAYKDVEHDLEIPPISIAAIKIEPLAPPEEIGGDK
jgi:hypothetical protein